MVHSSACECAGWPREPAQRYTQEWVGQTCLVPSPKGTGSPCAIEAFGWLRAGNLHKNAILAGVVFLSVRLCQAPLCHIQPPTATNTPFFARGIHALHIECTILETTPSLLMEVVSSQTMEIGPAPCGQQCCLSAAAAFRVAAAMWSAHAPAQSSRCHRSA